MNPSPGPWKLVPPTNDVAATYIADRNGNAILGGDDLTLIAAAPEMREMLLRLEWAGRDQAGREDADPIPCCPICAARPGEKIHARCRLGALLERIR
jgi:hypothetical protein